MLKGDLLLGVPGFPEGNGRHDRRDAIAWVRSVCTEQLQASQAKTLSVWVGAMLSVVRRSLAHRGPLTVLAA